MFSLSASSSSSVTAGGLVSRKTESVSGRGCAARRFARGTNSINSRSIHVVERKEDNGSEEPGGAGRGEVDSDGRVVIVSVGMSGVT